MKFVFKNCFALLSFSLIVIYAVTLFCQKLHLQSEILELREKRMNAAHLELARQNKNSVQNTNKVSSSNFQEKELAIVNEITETKPIAVNRQSELNRRKLRFAVGPKDAALFRLLQLSPVDLDKLRDLLVERLEANTNARDEAAARGIVIADPANWKDIAEKGTASVDEKIKQLLGEEKFAEYKLFEDTWKVRNEIDNLQDRLSYVGEPLRVDQVAALTGIVADSNTGSYMYPEIAEAAIIEAKDLLSPKQLKEFAALKEDLNRRRKIVADALAKATSQSAP
jgi:hypothetical protein